MKMCRCIRCKTPTNLQRKIQGNIRKTFSFVYNPSPSICNGRICATFQDFFYFLFCFMSNPICLIQILNGPIQWTLFKCQDFALHQEPLFLLRPRGEDEGCPTLQIMQFLTWFKRGAGGLRVKPMFKKNCRIRNSLTNDLIKASDFLPNVQNESA